MLVVWSFFAGAAVCEKAPAEPEHRDQGSQIDRQRHSAHPSDSKAENPSENTNPGLRFLSDRDS